MFFGSGGGQMVADRLSTLTGTKVELLGSVPLDPALRIGADDGNPIAITAPDSHTGAALTPLPTSWPCGANPWRVVHLDWA